MSDRKPRPLNHRIRRIDNRTGMTTTVAGSGKRGYDGDKGPAVKAHCNEPYEVKFDAAGSMYFVEMQNHLVRKVDAETKKMSTVAGMGHPGFSGDGGPAVKALLREPHSIAFDGAGSLYIADIGNHRVRRVDLQTGVIETIAGTGEENHVIRVVRAGTGKIETIVGDGTLGDGPDGPPLRCRLNKPHGVCVDMQGNVYIGDSSNNRVRKLMVMGQ